MSKSVKDLVANLMGTREGVWPSLQTFPPVHVEQVARQLRLEERGREAGSVGQPPPDAKRPDVAELDVTAEISRRARKATDEYLSQRELYEGRVQRAVITVDQRPNIEAAAQNALADLSAAIIDDQNHLHIRSQEVEGREEEFRAFRQRHSLTRLPKLVPAGKQVLFFMVLVLFVILESILNGMFFAEGSEGGVIGGIAQAFVLSLLNVGVAYLYARYGLPLLFTRAARLKVVGSVALLAFVAWLISLNLTIGHFRDLFIETEGRVPMTALLDRLSAAPFILADARSGLLVLLGIALGALAVIDAAAIRDLYPGFSEVGSERQRAIERYTDAQRKCLAALTRLRDQAVSDMTSAIELIRNSEYDMQLAIEGRSRLHENYTAFADGLAAAHERLIHAYREANLKARKVPAPMYFGDPVVRPAYLESPNLSPLPNSGPDVREEVIERIEHYIKLINEKFEHTLPVYLTVGQLTTPRAAGRGSA